MGEVEQPWMLGSMSRDGAEEVMKKANADEGAFFVRNRPDADGEYILVLMFKGKATHHLMKKDPSGFWTVNTRVFGSKTTLHELVKLLSTPGVTGWPVQLRTPITKSLCQSLGITLGEESRSNVSTNLREEILTLFQNSSPAPKSPAPTATPSEHTPQKEKEQRPLSPLATESTGGNTVSVPSAPPTQERKGSQQSSQQSTPPKQHEPTTPKSEPEQDRRQSAQSTTPSTPITPVSEDRRRTPSVDSHTGGNSIIVKIPPPPADVQTDTVHLSGGRTPPQKEAQWSVDEDTSNPPYLFGAMSRVEAEEYLQNEPEGSFLFRERPECPGDFILGITFRSKPTHHLVHLGDDGLLQVNGKYYGQCTTLPQLVATLNDERDWPIKLQYPIVNPATTTDQPDFREVSHTEVKLTDSVASPPSLSINAAPRMQAPPPIAEDALPAPPPSLRSQAYLDRASTVSLASGADSRPISTRPSELGDDDAFWSVEDDTLSVHSGVTSGLAEARTLLSGNAAMVISGRQGFASGINGIYERHFINHDSRPTFRLAAAPGKTKELFLYFHGHNRAWAIAEEIGSNRIVAYNPDSSALPCQARALWKITDQQGQFLDDQRVSCILGATKQAASTFRLALQKQRNVNICRVEIPEEQLRELCEELRSPLCAITQLKLFCNQLSTRTLQAVTKALGSNRSVTHLQLRENNINDESAACIAELIAVNPCIQLLSLRENSIGDDGIMRIAQALRVNTALTGVSLWGNEITDLGAAYLIDALQSNKTLQGLRLFSNRVGAAGLRRLQLRAREYSSCAVEITAPKGLRTSASTSTKA